MEIMEIICPNCNSQHRGDTPRCLIRPFFVACGQCSNRFLVNWKIKLPGESDTTMVVCSWCAQKQADSNQCSYCGRPFYDYSSDQQKEIKPLSRTSLSKTEKPPLQAGLRVTEGAAMPRFMSKLFFSGKLTLCIALLTVMALLGGTWAWYGSKNTEKDYLSNYVLALYGIRSGVELCGRTCGDIAAEWKKDNEAGRTASIDISPDRSEDLATVKGEIDRAMQKLEPPPEKFRDTSARLQKMYGIYLILNSLANNKPAEPLASFQLQVETARADFSREVQDLKQSMPPQLAEELQKYGKRYDLSFINN
jgi:hypothetical protein